MAGDVSPAQAGQSIFTPTRGPPFEPECQPIAYGKWCGIACRICGNFSCTSTSFSSQRERAPRHRKSAEACDVRPGLGWQYNFCSKKISLSSINAPM
jgi:hypothetical protein